jgi:histidinol phosphatase-like PHP family hydrolase
MEELPAVVERPQIRSEFLTFAHTRKILAQHTKWSAMLRGDLHMHTLWSDGSSTVAEMARAAEERGYRFIAITDHTKGLKIANGLNEQRLLEQGNEIDATNATLASSGTDLTILKSAEVNLSPTGQPDIDDFALTKLDLVIGSFHSALRRTEDRPIAIWRRCAPKASTFSVIRRHASTITGKVCEQIRAASLPKRLISIRRSKLMAMLTAKISK